MLARLKHIYGSEGFGGTLRWLAYRAGQSLITLDITEVMSLDAIGIRWPSRPAECFTFRALNAVEVEHYATDTANQLDPILVARLADGHTCFAALDGNRLAAYIWLGADRIDPHLNRGRQPNSGAGVVLPPHAVFLYSAFTRHDYRGQGLYGYVVARAFRELLAQGFDTIVTTCDWTNRSAIRSCTRLGYRRWGRLVLAGTGSWKILWPPALSRKLGVQFMTGWKPIPR